MGMNQFYLVAHCTTDGNAVGTAIKRAAPIELDIMNSVILQPDLDYFSCLEAASPILKDRGCCSLWEMLICRNLTSTVVIYFPNLGILPTYPLHTPYIRAICVTLSCLVTVFDPILYFDKIPAFADVHRIIS